MTQRLDTRNAGEARNTSGTTQSILPSAETLGSRVFAYKHGQAGGAYLLTSIAAVIGRRAVRNAQSASIERVLDDALLNPEVAALLLKENNPANRAARRRRGKGWFGNEIALIVNAMSGEERSDDPTMEAIGAR